MNKEIPKELRDLGFVPNESWINPWACERIFHPQLSVEVWESAGHGKPGLILVQIKSDEIEQTATVATGYKLSKLLPTIGALLNVCDAAPRAE